MKTTKSAKLWMCVATFLLLATAAWGEVYVTNVACAQRYPWNGMVDIDYEVVADDPDADVWVYCTGKDGDLNVSMAPRAVSGDGADGPVKPGKHRMTWDVSADYPGFATTSFTVSMCALVGGAPYMVVDLSGGVDALEYPVSYLSSVPAGGWTDEYKTDKMVLRLIPPGTFLMGSPTDELGFGWNNKSYETRHQVTLTQPFYIGVFEVTQKQYELVMGSNPAFYKGNTKAVESVSYSTIRGTVNGAAWPAHNQVDANSFMGRLRSKANMMFDLPTEAQWEYACRAGTGTALNSGKNLTGTENCGNLAEVGWYKGNASQSQVVGQKLPNAWGIYDMHGNVAEWCLDWWVDNLGSGAKTDPKGGSSGSYRVVRGGCWSDRRLAGHAAACRSGYRSNDFGVYPSTYPDRAYGEWGFRACCQPAD
jgi:formylglycine-generating enzyme required for sulfatase activity